MARLITTQAWCSCLIAYSVIISRGVVCDVIRVLTFMTLLLLVNLTVAQTSRDSLKVVAESSLHDSLRLDAILLITDDFHNEDELKYISLGKELAKRNLNTPGNNASSRLTYLEALDKLCIDEAWAQNALFSNAERALHMSRSCLNEWHSNRRNSLMGQAFNNMAVQHYYLGAIDSAMHYQHLALELRRNLPDKKGYAQSLISMGYISFRGGIIGPSIPYFLEAIDILEEINDMEGLEYGLRMLGIVYSEMEEYGMLLELAKRRLALVLQYNSHTEIASAYNGIAVSWNGLQRYDSAAYYYEKCVSIIPLLEKGQQSKGFMWLTNYATFLQATGNLEKALTTINQAAQMAGTTDNFEEKARIADVKALIYNDLNMPDSAIFYGNIVMSEAERTDRWDLLATAGERLQKAYFAKKNFEQAYHYQSIARQYNDSLLNRENTRQTERAELMYKFNKQESETRARQAQRDAIAAAELQHERNLKNIGFIIGSLVLLLALGLYRRYRFKQRVADELKTKNAEINAARQRAERSEAFRKQFLANMSHEIRTPLNAIIGLNRLLIRKSHADDVTGYLTASGQAAENLKLLVDDILDLSKLEAGKMELNPLHVDLHDALNNFEVTFTEQARSKGLTYKQRIDAAVPRFIEVDLPRALQILNNLISNAIKFTDKGSVELNVTTKLVDTLEFTVRDTGVGIAPEHRSSVFEQFSQVALESPAVIAGTGLGLTISKALAERLGGGLVLADSSEAGSTFVFTLPFRPGRPDAVKKNAAPELSERQRLYPIRILLADDSEHNITVARDSLLTYFGNAEISTASNGNEAIEQVKGKSFDVILLDVRMPSPDGFECTRLIRSLPDERKASTPIYAFTASVIRSDIQKCLDAGMNGYIPKPFADSELISPVAERINALPDRTIGKDKHAKPRPTAHEMFVKLIPLRLQTLEQAIDQRDFKAISDVVHLMRPQLLASGWSAQEPQLNAFDTLPKKEEEEAWMLAAQELAERLKSMLNERLSNLP